MGRGCFLRRYIATFIVSMFLIGTSGGCSSIRSYFEHPPIEEGTFLTYDLQGGTYLVVTFSKTGSNQFDAVETVTFENEDHTDFGFDEENRRVPSEQEAVKTIVDGRLNTKRKTPYQPGRLGPLWVAPSNVKVGGSAHGATFAEVKEWKGWDVGVVSAGFGRGGAVTGGWYYERKTGLLVGGFFTTAMSDDPEEFILVDTNIKNLML